MHELTVNQAQKMVDQWINQFEEGYWPPLAILANIMEEVGELAKEINSREKYKKKKQPEAKKDIGLELADILFSLMCMANYYSINLENKFKEAIQKYSIRDINRWKKKNNQ